MMKLVALLVVGMSLAVGKQELGVDWVLEGRDEDVAANDVAWNDVEQDVGGDVLAGSQQEEFACTNDVGPNMDDCPAAIQEIESLSLQHNTGNGFISVRHNRCRSTSSGCCRAVLCARGGRPNDVLRMRPSEFEDRMWRPLSSQCVRGGHGGVLHNGHGGYLHMVGDEGVDGVDEEDFAEDFDDGPEEDE
ncbi:hypothetical protein CDD81_6858 [Ophiocordyceps australis]|uniref:Uncharacterized protein n=1 Tax=Ophiocordyceps australis TaxID=1399860 RepID=A0A2C5Y6N8_9HYPO|nr:hypothetical protein CDD81_6858 [Ophiocordyceps australis]